MENKTEVTQNELMMMSRPKNSLFDLSKWAEMVFSENVGKNPNCYINNHLLMNDSLISYCNKNNYTIECLYKDPIISWKEKDKERYLPQGVFLIKGNNLEFLQCSLFTINNKGEDEVGFFALVSDKYNEEYLSFKSKFEKWSNFEDKDNLYVKVVGGVDVPYERNSSWDDLFLPDDLKKDIKFTIESFLNNKDFYVKNKISWKRGILLYGPQGCGKTTLLKTIISNYDIKPVTVPANPDEAILAEAFEYAESQSPSLLYFEDLDSTFNNIDVSTFLNLIDGISSKDGLLLMASANDISRFIASISDRPSRFDRKIKIPLPDLTMINKYIGKFFDTLSKKDVKEISSICGKNKLTYAHLKELYVSSVLLALSKQMEKPTRSDIDESLKIILADRSIKKQNIGLDKYNERDTNE